MLDRHFTHWQTTARRHAALHRLAIVSRILLALAFVPTGLVKLAGLRFTALSPATPVGAFFEAMYQTGAYWRFLGAGQVTAGLLLLIPATATLGAVACFPIMLNITVITWAIDFTGTKYITALMLLASLFLLCWDYDRWRGILFRTADLAERSHVAPLPTIERVGYLVGTGAGLVVMFGTRGLAPGPAAVVGLGAGAVAACMVVVGWWTAWRRP